MNEKTSQVDSTGVDARLDRIEMAMLGTAPTEELNLGEVFRTLWGGKWFIAAVTVLSAVMSVAVVLWLPNQYRATALLTPATNSGASSLSRLAGQFGGLAALAGVNIGGVSDEGKTVEAMELVKSWAFQDKFIRDNQLEAPIFAATSWDRSRNQLVFDRKIYDPLTKKWVRSFDLGSGQSVEPSSWELYEKFSKRISISQDRKTNMISLSVEYYSPYLAKEWTDKIVASVNQYLKERDRNEAKASIEYLQKQMSQTSLTEMKSVFSRLIEEQTKTLMLTDVSDEYALKKLVSVNVPEKKSTPNRALICVLGTAGGFVISAIACLFFRRLKR